jgi:hypothetical protein
VTARGRSLRAERLRRARLARYDRWCREVYDARRDDTTRLDPPEAGAAAILKFFHNLTAPGTRAKKPREQWRALRVYRRSAP